MMEEPAAHQPTGNGAPILEGSRSSQPQKERLNLPVVNQVSAQEEGKATAGAMCLVLEKYGRK